MELWNMSLDFRDSLFQLSQSHSNHHTNIAHYMTNKSINIINLAIGTPHALSHKSPQLEEAPITHNIKKRKEDAEVHTEVPTHHKNNT